MKNKELQKLLSAVIQKNNLDTELNIAQLNRLNEVLRAMKDEANQYEDEQVEYETAQVIQHLMKALVYG